MFLFSGDKLRALHRGIFREQDNTCFVGKVHTLTNKDKKKAASSFFALDRKGNVERDPCLLFAAVIVFLHFLSACIGSLYTCYTEREKKS